MDKELTATERVSLEKELNDIMLGAEQTDDQTKIKDRYKKAGEIMVQLNLLDSAHKNIPEVVARVYAQYTRQKIEKIVNSTRN